MNMKRIHLLICLALFSLLMASCGEEEALFQADNATHLELCVVAENFVSTNETTRATEEGYITNFTSGDQIGIFAVKTSNGFVLDKNIPYEYKGTAWVPTHPANTVHSYDSYLDDVTYFAYYPYSADMDDATSEANIQAKFTPKPDQSTYANYTASDLMTGAGTLSATGDTRTLTLELKHRMALLVLCPDPYATCTAPAGAGYEYYTEARTKGTITNAKINNAATYAVGDDTYRLLVAPAADKMDISLEYTLGTSATSCTISEQTLTAGTYHQFKMGHPALTVEREVQIGDYFYNNGKLMPGANGEEPADKGNCIGVVFHVGPGQGDKLDYYAGTGLGSRDKIRGYVVALKNQERNAIYGEKAYKWADSENLVGASTNTTDFLGYANTSLILKNVTNPEAAQAAKDYSWHGSPPANSSGWYLGSAGQMARMAENRKSKLASSLQKAGGVDFYGVFWTSTEVDKRNASIIGIGSSTIISHEISNTLKTFAYTYTSRSVLTF